MDQAAPNEKTWATYPMTRVPISPPTCRTRDCNERRVERFSLGTFELNMAAKGDPSTPTNRKNNR